MIIDKIRSKYRDIAESHELLLAGLKKKHLIISVLRLLVFIGGGIITVFTFIRDPLTGLISVTVTLSFFIYLIFKTEKYNYEISYCNNIIRINNNEVKALGGDYSDFDGGDRFNDTSHDFAADTDLFGDNSLFRYLNRTVTGTGTNCLVGWLLNPYSLREKIPERQEAVTELAERLEWRQRFLASGIDKRLNDDDISDLIDWLNETESFFSSGFFKRLSFIMPSLLFAALFLAIPGLIPYTVFNLLFLINLFLTGFFLKKINRIHEKVSKKHEFLSSFRMLISSFEKEHFRSAVLKEIYNRICKDEHSASNEIGELGRIIKAFDSRLNILAGFFLNGLILWDFHCIIRLEKWRKSEAEYLPVWLNSIGEVDGYISLANYAWNNPGYAYPVPGVNGPVFSASCMGHPLLGEDKRVNNDISVTKQGMVFIITGANMAGKSTFLRSVALNMVLAMTGAPVCAQSMKFMPVIIFTSMRTVDSLSANESYFYAELKRLRTLKERLEKDEQIFFILDEILKGTNSTDKSMGSKQFLRMILSLKGTGMIATHDISLGSLEEEYPERVVNKCFEIEIAGESISFDYILRDGITKKMNAAILMKQMGIA